MPYITEKTLEEATEVVRLLENLMLRKGISEREDLEENAWVFENEIFARYFNIVETHTKASSKKNYKPKMCPKCDCLCVKMAEHQATFKCQKAFKAKQFVVVDKKAKNPEIVSVVNAMIMRKFKSNFKTNAIKKSHQVVVENLKKLDVVKKQKINKRVERVMKKKMSGIELETRTPNQIAYEQKQRRIEMGIPVKHRTKKPVVEEIVKKEIVKKEIVKSKKKLKVVE